MLKKFLIGTFVVGAMLSASVALASYDFGTTTTLKVGSKGEAVKAVQTLVGATVDGSFGPMTAAKVKVWQAANGLTADGVFGAMSKAKANAGTTTGGTLPAGCTSTAGYSSTTGAKCDGSTTVGTDNGPLTGGAGDLEITTTSTDVENEVVEGTDEKVLGFKVEAMDSDVLVKNLKLTLENTDTDGSYRVADYVDTVEIYMGSTKVGEVAASDFSKDGHVYSKSVTLNNAIIRQGSSKKATFYVVVNAISNIDGDDIGQNSWDLSVDNVRFQDATGVIMTSDDTTLPLEKTFIFTDLAGSGDLDFKVSKGSSSPIAQNVEVSDTGSTSNVLMLEFKLKAEGSDFSFDQLDVALDGTVAGAKTLADVLGELTLKEGSTELASYSDFTAADDQNVTFELDDTYTVDKDDTVTFRVYAKVNDVDNYTSGDSLKVSFLDVDAEDDNGDVISESGSAAGETQTFVSDVPTFALVGTPTLAVSTHTDGTATGEEDMYKATFVFNVTAPENQDVFLPLDTFAYGTAGTSGVEYTVTGGSTITSAAMEYSGTGDIDETSSYKVAEGTTEKFTLNVYLKGNDLQGKVAMTSVWYEISDTTPNGTPEVTSGFTNFKTPLVLLAK